MLFELGIIKVFISKNDQQVFLNKVVKQSLNAIHTWKHWTLSTWCLKVKLLKKKRTSLGYKSVLMWQGQVGRIWSDRRGCTNRISLAMHAKLTEDNVVQTQVASSFPCSFKWVHVIQVRSLKMTFKLLIALKWSLKFKLNSLWGRCSLDTVIAADLSLRITKEQQQNPPNLFPIAPMSSPFSSSTSNRVTKQITNANERMQQIQSKHCTNLAIHFWLSYLQWK